METNKKRGKSLAILLLMSMASSASYAYSCHRHIYNDSDEAWEITVTPNYGRVHFLGTGCPPNGPCIIPAHSQPIEIQYTTSYNLIAGAMQFKDKNGENHLFAYSDGRHFHRCPKISGSNSTVKFNEADGDIRIHGSAWSPTPVIPPEVLPSKP